MQARSAATFLSATLVVCCLFALALPQPAAAQSEAKSSQTLSYQIGPGTLDSALNKFSTQSKLQVVYSPELVTGKTSPGLSGRYTPEQALRLLLKDTGVTWDAVNGSMYVLRPVKGEVDKRALPKSGPLDTKKASVADVGVKDLKDIVVVGSRLGGSPVESAMPIKVITQEEIERSGASDIAQVLAYLPEVPINNGVDRAIYGQEGVPDGGNINATTVQMRGLPRGSTLILINGRRAGHSSAFTSSGIFDLSTVPISLVERIEVLPAGSSAVYGGDGLAGVINVVLKSNANALELRLRQSEAKGYSYTTANGLWGASWDSGGITLAASWSKKGDLLNSEREISSSLDFTRYGGGDYRQDHGYPATVISLDGCPESEICLVPMDQRGNLPGLSAPIAVVPSGRDGLGLTPEDFLQTQGQASKATPQRQMISKEQSYGFHITAHQELDANIEVFTELTHTRREMPAKQIELPILGGEYGLSVLSADHPLNPFGVRVGVNALFLDTGHYMHFEQKNYRGLLGVKGQIGRFAWELSGWKVSDESVADGASGFDLDAINRELAGTGEDFIINPFVSNGSAPGSPNALASLLRKNLLSDMNSKTSGFTGFVKGDVLALPGGNVSALFGLESQTHSVDYESNSSTDVIPVHGKSTNRAAFAEARVPLIPARPNTAETLALTSALRSETSDRFSGSANTYTAGIEFRPYSSLLLRATYSTAFKPVVTHTASETTSFEYSNAVFDPALNGQWYYVRQIYSGGAPSTLRPETSETATWGLVYRPSNGWGLSLTHWDMKFKDQFGYLTGQDLVDNEAEFPDRVIRDPETNLIELIDARQINIAVRDTTGVDLGVDASMDTDIGLFYSSIAATYTYRFEQKLTEASQLISNLARRDSLGWAPRWKIVSRLAWDYKDVVRLMFVGRYISSYEDPTPLSSGPSAGKYQTLGDFWIVDFNMDMPLGRIFGSQRYWSETSITLGATNVLNRKPDFCASCYATGYDSTQYDIVGRMLYAELKLGF